MPKKQSSNKKPPKDEMGYVSPYRARQKKLAATDSATREALKSGYFGPQGDRKRQLDEIKRAEQFTSDFKRDAPSIKEFIRLTRKR